MKKFTAVMAVVMVLSVALISATPATAAPQISTVKSAPAAAIGLLERVMQLLGLSGPRPMAPTTGAPAPTSSPDGAIWGRCALTGTC